MRLTDGTRTIEIEMVVRDGDNVSSDWSNDFFEAKYDEGLDAYHVNDVDYAVEQAMDWKYSSGDFQGTDDIAYWDKDVYVDGVYMTDDEREDQIEDLHETQVNKVTVSVSDEYTDSITTIGDEAKIVKDAARLIRGYAKLLKRTDIRDADKSPLIDAEVKDIEEIIKLTRAALDEIEGCIDYITELTDIVQGG